MIENVWTAPDRRCEGLGSALLRAMLDCCWGANCYTVMSGTHRDGAHEFYERLGFDTHAKQGFVIRVQIIRRLDAWTRNMEKRADDS